MLSQLTSYGIFWWLVFASVPLIASRRGGYFGFICGHVVITMIVITLDLLWIQSEIHDPDWDGTPDQDIVFIIGVAIRVFLVNTIVLPMSVLGGEMHSMAQEYKSRDAIRRLRNNQP